MEDQDKTLYRTNSATFELPCKLKDRTMHIFTLNDDGPSDFSMVISHADFQPDEKLTDFADRLISEMSKALPKFELEGKAERMLDGSPAVELAYNWRNDGHFMHQRQVIVVVPGPTRDSTRAMLIAATCLRPFNEEWNATFDQAVASMRLRKAGRATTAVDPTDAVAVPVQPGYVFALSERRRVLRVFANPEEACGNTDAREVEQQAWAFFDVHGHGLHPRFVVPNTGTLWKKAGSYVLETRADLPREDLRECLHRAALFQNGASEAPFASIGEVRDFLDRQSTD
jgi:hypothetical protein